MRGQSRPRRDNSRQDPAGNLSVCCEGPVIRQCGLKDSTGKDRHCDGAEVTSGHLSQYDIHAYEINNLFFLLASHHEPFFRRSLVELCFTLQGFEYVVFFDQVSRQCGHSNFAFVSGLIIFLVCVCVRAAVIRPCGTRSCHASAAFI